MNFQMWELFSGSPGICVRFYHVNNINLLFRPAMVMYLCFLIRNFLVTEQTSITAIFVIVEVFILLKN